jgi:hypothetical protein
MAEALNIMDLSPAEAKSQLDAMTEAYRTSAAKPAATKLSGMLANGDFLRTIDYGGTVPGLALPRGSSFDKLQEAVAEFHAEQGDPVSRAMAGHLDEINDSKALQMKQTADVLRGMEIDDGAIRQLLAGEPVSRAEYDRVKVLKRDMMENQPFVAAFLNGDRTATRQMMYANIVLTSPIKEDAA